MTHQNHQTNGASLEDCHTNFFALADLCGIKWKKLVLNERPHASGDPLDDPVLKSYTKCLAKDILCVWRRVSQHKNDLDQTGGMGMFDMSQIGATSVTHPPLSLTAAKELWIFWYGEEPDLTDLVSPELLKSSDSEQGSWESGLSYECRSLLFKALHNLIERCLLSRDIIRIGKWFVQPSLEKNREKSSPHLSFSFAFFVHGESTVCASMDIREHPPIRPLTEEYLNEVIKNTQQNMDNCSLNDDEEKEDFNDNHTNVSMQTVILAPFGLSAVLTGNRSESGEQFTEKFLNDWNNFYPMRDSSDNNASQSKLPPLVEVNSGGIKMWYPSKYVLLTDLDLKNEMKSDTKCSESNTKNIKKNVNSNNNSNSLSSSNNNDNISSSVNCETIKSYRFSEIEKEYIESSVSNFCDGIQKSAAGILPERAWQDSIMNPAYTDATASSVTNVKSEHKNNNEKKNENAQSENNIENSINAANGIESSTKADTAANTWNFMDPTLLKTTCGCSRCKNLENCGNSKAPGNSTSSSSLSGKNFRNNSYRIRMPFHKRSDSTSHGSKSKDRCFSNQPSTSSKFNIRSSCKNGGSQSNGGNAMTSETSQQMSIGSVGSIQSPMHHNLSVHSQPSSVLVNEQNILSPIPPSDISPPTMTPLSDNNIDQKPDVQTLNVNEKRSDNSQPGMTTENSDASLRNDFRNCGNSEKQSDLSTKENMCLKRPLLKTQDCDTVFEDDLSTNDMLYDYSSYDAWMNYPIKRFKPDELRNNSNRLSYPKQDIYSGEQQAGVGEPSSSSQTFNATVKQEGWKSSDESKSTLTSNINKETESNERNSDNLFTNRLEPSLADITKIFDNSDDNSNDDHLDDNTPPGSNNSIVHPEMDHSDGNDTKREKMTFGNFSSLTNNGLTALINSNTNAIGHIRNEELSKMFPTPPSIEQHTNSSPGGICGINNDNLMETIEMANVNQKVEHYQNLGSPLEESIDDWSYVFIPPKVAAIYGASRYAPLTNLISQSQNAITLPSTCSYVPSWVKQKEQEDVRKKRMEDKNEEQKMSVPPPMSSTETVAPPTPTIEIKKEIKTEAMSPLMKPVPALSPYGARGLKNDGSTSIINKLLSSPSPSIYKQVHTPMASPLANFNSPYSQDALFRKSMGIPMHPPPPYDTAINSPSLNSNLHGACSDDISNNNKKLISNKNLYMKHSLQMGQKAPEANSLLVNVLLYDTSLNIFRDHNFDSCTICVCNVTSATSVGNIRGLDSGIYLSLTSSCHFTENVTSIVEKSQESRLDSCLKRDQLGDIKYFGNNRNFTSDSICESPRSELCLPSGIKSGPSTGCTSSSSDEINQCANVVDLMLNGYQDDDPMNCRCGFSSVVNRRLAHRTGLFYEDEMEITGIANDPSSYKMRSLVSFLLKQNKKLTQGQDGDNKGLKLQQDNSNKDRDECSMAQLASIFDLVRSQCTIFQNSSNSIQRVIKHLNHEKYSPMLTNKHVNFLEFTDAFDIITLALEQGRHAFEKFDGYNNRPIFMQQKKQLEKRVSTSQAISVHKWPFINAAGPKSNQDIIRVMKSMKVLLQKAFNQNGTTGLWDAPYAVKGPLTWREFHRLAGRGIGQCEPQPIPSIVVGHDKEWLCISPYALQFWDKLLLEPYSQPKDIAYIVITPDNSFITSKVKTYFKELSTTYEMCRLGRHQPIRRWDGLLRVGKNMVNQDGSLNDEWLQSSESLKLNELLRLYGYTLQEQLVPFLQKASQDKSLLFPETNQIHHHHHHSRAMSSAPSPMLPPHTPEPHTSGNGNNSSSDRGPTTPKSDLDDTRDNLNTSGGGNALDTLGPHYDISGNPPHIVVYIVEPFTSGTDSTSVERMACLSLLKYYSNLLNSVPENIKTNISLHVVAQESILELGKNRNIDRWSDHMKNFALNVFSQSHRYQSHLHNVKSLTGFGTAANGDLFIKSKDEKNRAPVKLFTPAYILSTRNAKSENNENFGQCGMEQQCCSIMYCCYCLSEDQNMLIAVVTDERGELLENCTINIDVPNRKRRKKSSARRFGLQKLMDFILGVMSQTVKPWRLVVGRIGRIGHGELKGWSWLLSRQNLLKSSKHLKDICKQCSYMYSQAVPSIWSACLVTLEPDSNFRVMADQFTPDERFSQRSTQSPLSTPQDVSCTHILVFPTSAVLQSSQATFNSHFDTALDFGEEFLMPPDGEEDDELKGIQDIFSEWNDGGVLQQGSPTRDSHRDSPQTMHDSKNRLSPGLNDNQSGPTKNLYSYSDTEEVGQLLQQPLALGYLVSTAPTGRMPSWFWECCPHLENVCPVFLKTSLHIHSPSIHKENDDVLYKEQSTKIEHPLDSNTTADVLRYVLEGYNVLSWLAMDSNTHDRLSCLPIHVQMLMQLYHLQSALA